MLATASSVNATLYASSGLTAMLAEVGQFPPFFGRGSPLGSQAGLLITAAIVLVVSNVVDLSAIASVGSACSLLIFLLVGVAGYRLRASTGARGPIVLLGMAATAVVLVFFAIDTVRTRPRRSPRSSQSRLWRCSSTLSGSTCARSLRPPPARSSHPPPRRSVGSDEVMASDALEHGRLSYAKRAWLDAYEWLSRADEDDLLEPQDLELLARSAYMLGRDDDYLRGLERAHHGHLDAGEVPSAARCTWWIGHNLLMRGETARATGWFGRGDRLLDREGLDCVERGYLLIPVGLQADGSGDARAAYATWTEAAAIGERYGDPDLVMLAWMGQAHALVQQGRTEEGFRLVDETMVAVTTGELSPIVAGIVYCNTIRFCQEAHEVRRAREWTNALTEWCDRQPDMVAHTGVCLVHPPRSCSSREPGGPLSRSCSKPMSASPRCR